MTFDVNKHNLVPKHSKLSDKERGSILSKFRIIEKDLPKIIITDPAITSLGVKPGDIIKIERKSLTAGIAYHYRLVLDG